MRRTKLPQNEERKYNKLKKRIWTMALVRKMTSFRKDFSAFGL